MAVRGTQPIAPPRFEPPIVRSVEQTGLSESFLANLVLKLLYYRGHGITGFQISDEIKLPFTGVLEPVRAAGLAGRKEPVLDALAAVAPEGKLLVSIVHRGVSGPVRVRLSVSGHRVRNAALHLLSAAKPWDANTLDEPGAVAPVKRDLRVEDNALEFDLPPFSVAVVHAGG